MLSFYLDNGCKRLSQLKYERWFKVLVCDNGQQTAITIQWIQLNVSIITKSNSIPYLHSIHTQRICLHINVSLSQLCITYRFHLIQSYLFGMKKKNCPFLFASSTKSVQLSLDDSHHRNTNNICYSHTHCKLWHIIEFI